jgi:predicted dehydrogenase
MLKVGILGCGFMGWIHWNAYQQIAGIEVAAICTKEAHRLAGDWTDIRGNFGPPGEQVDLSNIGTYAEMNEFIKHDSLDLIDICLPPALHADAIELAAAAGKHVFCEKPLGLNVDQCDRAVTACKVHRQMLMVGHVLPFFPEYKLARDIIASGEYGEILGGSFRRVISDPTWLTDYYDPDKIGGPLFDLHIHDAHFIRLIFGMPNNAYSSGRMRNGVVEYCVSTFGFDNGYVVNSVSGVIHQQGRPFNHGFEIHLERATLQFEFASLLEGTEQMPLKILKPDGSVEYPRLNDGDPVDAFVAEIKEVRDAVLAGVVSPILSGELALDAVRLCEAQRASVAETAIVHL